MISNVYKVLTKCWCKCWCCRERTTGWIQSGRNQLTDMFKYHCTWAPQTSGIHSFPWLIAHYFFLTTVSYFQWVCYSDCVNISLFIPRVSPKWINTASPASFWRKMPNPNPFSHVCSSVKYTLLLWERWGISPCTPVCDCRILWKRLCEGFPKENRPLKRWQW